jgi:hypothetical protein
MKNVQGFLPTRRLICFKLGIDSTTTKIRINFQTRSDSQIRVCVQTDSNDNMVSLNLMK